MPVQIKQGVWALFEGIGRKSSVWRDIFLRINAEDSRLYLSSLCREQGLVLPTCSSTFDAFFEIPRSSKDRFQDVIGSDGNGRKKVPQTWDWLLSCEQTKGRGQYSRQWQSPLGSLFVSQQLPELSSGPLAQFDTLLPMLLTSAILQHLKLYDFTRTRSLRLKWPNDLVAFDRKSGQLLGKVGGLLLECKKNTRVFGLGLNLVPLEPEADSEGLGFSREGVPSLGQPLPPCHLPLDELSLAGQPVNLLEFWCNCSKALQAAWLLWRNYSLTELKQEIIRVLAFRSEKVALTEFHSETGQAMVSTGELIGLDDSGALVLRTAQGLITKKQGSLRPLT